MWVIDYQNLNIKKSLVEVPGLKWEKKSTKGNVPGPRYGHSLEYFIEKVFLFGGNSTFAYSKNMIENSSENDPGFSVFILDVNTLCWSQILSEMN